LEDATVDLSAPEFLDASLDTESIAEIDLGIGSEMTDVKPMFSGRSGAMKQAMLAIYGGTEATQEAVAKGLKWLQRNQMRDGSWSLTGPYSDGGISENKVAATAMAVLAFLGDGNTHQRGTYQREVDRGVKYLIKQQDRSGFFAKSARSHQQMYAQAQASIALCELYGMTRDSWLRARCQLSIDFAEAAQSSEGGWRYRPKGGSDTSVTGWFVMALKSGQSAGLEVDPQVFYNVDRYLDAAQDFGGAAYSYQIRGRPSPAMTAEGLLCRQYNGWKRDKKPMVEGVHALVEVNPFEIRDQNVYYWYYATQVMHHFGGQPWRVWNAQMRVQLPAAQIASGRESGSWPPQRDAYGQNYGRLYTTCLAIYCLEVYYRHMPLYSNAVTYSDAGTVTEALRQ
jgi:hypothetical protein